MAFAKGMRQEAAVQRMIKEGMGNLPRGKDRKPLKRVI
jgi:hypothetical protein